jgi:hypothetical protein
VRHGPAFIVTNILHILELAGHSPSQLIDRVGWYASVLKTDGDVVAELCGIEARNHKKLVGNVRLSLIQVDLMIQSIYR